MSIHGFIHRGDGKFIVEVSGAPPYPDPWPIKVFDIDEPDLIGVLYPDKARQVHPYSWWEQVLTRHGYAKPRPRLLPPEKRGV